MLTPNRTGGGAICLEGRGVTCSIAADVMFTENSAAHRGGAIAVINGTNLSITGITFKRNQANRGGALYIEVRINGSDWISTAMTFPVCMIQPFYKDF